MMEVFRIIQGLIICLTFWILMSWQLVGAFIYKKLLLILWVFFSCRWSTMLMLPCWGIYALKLLKVLKRGWNNHCTKEKDLLLLFVPVLNLAWLSLIKGVKVCVVYGFVHKYWQLLINYVKCWKSVPTIFSTLKQNFCHCFSQYYLQLCQLQSVLQDCYEKHLLQQIIVRRLNSATIIHISRIVACIVSQI